MFQYAAGLFYAGQCNAQMEMVIDPPRSAHSHGQPRPFLLPHFTISAQYRQLNMAERYLFLNDHRRLKPAVKSFLQRRVFQDGLHVQLISESLEQRFRFQAQLPINLDMRVIYLAGYWQVHDIADKISAALRREFAFREPPSGQNLEVLRAIQNTENSVSLHIRRGDYTLAAEGNVALPLEYYLRAVADCKEALREPTFFIFSDDINFAKETFGRDRSAVFVDHNDSFSAHEDLRLMSSCCHHILANSTFSWWGAWLNANPWKMVWAPRNWRVANCPADNDLFPSSWRLLDDGPVGTPHVASDFG